MKWNSHSIHAQANGKTQDWLKARHMVIEPPRLRAFAAALSAHQQGEQNPRRRLSRPLSAINSGTNHKDSDYVFITFILDQLPHGVIGLLSPSFFAAALSSKAAELNALGSTTTVDFYRHIVSATPRTTPLCPSPNGSPILGAGRHRLRAVTIVSPRI